MATLAFQVEGLRKVFQMGRVELEVLKGLELEVAAGEIVAVVGASGSGKTSLLNCLGGFDTPTAGRICLHGIDVYAQTPSRRTRLRADRIGFVFQSYHLLPELDAMENVMLPARNKAWGWGAFLKAGREFFQTSARESPQARAMSLIKAVGLADRADHLPDELSGGEQQRAALARALMRDPDVVLADEPTGNLDPETGRHVLDYLIALVRNNKKTMMLVTHNLEIAYLADRVLELRAGLLVPIAKQI